MDKGQYDEVIYNDDNQLYIVEKEGKFGFIEKSGEAITDLIFDFYHIYWGFATVRKGNQVGHLFFHEGTKEPLAYRTVEIFEVKRGNKYGIKSSSGETIIPCQYDFIRIYGKLIIAQNESQYYLYDLIGKLLFDTPFEYVDFQFYYEKMPYLIVKQFGKWGVIVNDNWIIPPIAISREDIRMFDYATYVILVMDGKEGIYDRNGKRIIPCIYDEIEIVPYWRFIVCKDGKYGLIDKSGKTCLPYIYDKIVALVPDIYEVSISGDSKIFDIRSLRNNLSGFTAMQADNTDTIELSHDLISIGDYYYKPILTENVGRNYNEALKWYLLAFSIDNYEPIYYKEFIDDCKNTISYNK